MKKFLPLMLLLLLPSVAWSQGGLHVSSVVGKVEIRPASNRTFGVLMQNTRVQIGDEIRTGPGSQLILALPDQSYMVINSESRLVVQDVWSGSFHNLVNLALGHVRFYVQKFGGRSNPYRVQTPTALIAVRGTIFDVVVDSSESTQVDCLEGSVAVEALLFPGEEKVLLPGRKTLVFPGQPPLTPIASAADFENRKLAVVKKGPGDAGDIASPSLDGFMRNNDRMNRPGDRMGAPASQNDPTVTRAKSTMTYPE